MARHLQALGHRAKLISPQFVRPFVQGNKNDFADAQAICETASRPSMRFVSPRNEAQQTVSALHRVRESRVREHTRVINQVHAFLLEFGISLPRGQAIIRRLPAVLAEHELPRLVALLERLQAHFKYLDEQVSQIERELCQQLREDERSQRLLEIPGIGPITASVLMTELGDAWQFGSARQFAASVGLVLGVQADGQRDVLGLWVEQTEGAKFWLKVFNELKTRGCQDILIAVVDGLKGLADAIATAFPRTTVQTCIVHLIRNSLDYAGWKDRKAVAAPLRPIYAARQRTSGRAGAAGVRRWTLGNQVPHDRRCLAMGLGERHAVLRVPSRHQASDLHDQRHRELEHAIAQDHQDARPLPHR